jgi:hypothetical protein
MLTEAQCLAHLNHSNSNVRRAIFYSKSPHITEAMLLQGLEDQECNVRSAVFQCKSSQITETVLQQGLKDQNFFVRIFVLHSRSPHLNEALLWQGLADQDSDVRRAVFESNSPHLTEVMLRQGLADQDSKVRTAVLWSDSPHLAEALLWQGLEDQHFFVRSVVFESNSPHLTEAMLRRGLADLHSRVRCAIFYSKSAHLTEALLRQGLADQDSGVRRAVYRSQSPQLTEVLLRQGLADQDSEVRRAVFQTQSPHLTEAMLWQGLADQDCEVRRAVFQTQSPQLTEALLRQGLADQNSGVRRDVFYSESPHLTDALLRQGLADQDSDVRSHVFYSKSPHLTDVMLRQGLLDHKRQVRCFAMSALIHRIGVRDEVSQDLKPFSAMTILREKDFLFLLDEGFDIESLFAMTSPRNLCKYLIGTSHPVEMTALFGQSSESAYHAIGVLQAAFHNPRKDKTDRHGYLAHLAFLNDSGLTDLPNGLTAAAYRDALMVFGESGLAGLRSAGAEITGIRDSLRALSTVLRNPDKDAAQSLAQVRKWLEKKPLAAFHDYIIKKAGRELKSGELSTFPQALLNTPAAGLASTLPVGLHLFIPKDKADLRVISKEQRHCVGRLADYAEECVAGNEFLFVLSPSNGEGQPHLSRGWTFQYGKAGQLLQTNGFGNLPKNKPPAAIVAVSETVARVMSAALKHVNALSNCQNRASWRLHKQALN